MRGTLPALTGAAAVLARQGEDALESSVFISPLDFYRVGKIKVDATGAAVYEAIPGVSLSADFPDIHLRCDDGAVALSGSPTVTLDVTVDSAADTAEAAFSVPGWRNDQGNSFPLGGAEDFIPKGAGNADKAITAISGVAEHGNLPNNSEWSVWASPAASTFVEMGFKRNATGAYQVPGQIEIPDRYEAAAVVKRGRSESPELTLDFVHIHSWDGLALYNGHPVTALVKVVRDRSVHVGWDIYTGYRPESSPSRGDGNEEVVASSAGPYQTHLLFSAK